MICFGNYDYGVEIGRICGVEYVPHIHRNAAYVKDRELVAGVMWERIVPGASAWVHMATQKTQYIPRDLLWAACHLSFSQWRCKKLFGPIAEHNKRALRIATRLGFKEEARLEGMYPEACVILSLEPANCWCLDIKPRFFEVPHGWQPSSSA